MLVKELMTKHVYTVTPDTSLKEVGKMLKEKKISGVPVINDDGVLVGIVTLTDMLRILSRIYEWKQMEKEESQRDLSVMFEDEKSNAKVKDIMTKDIVTLSEDDTIDDIMKLMFENKIHTIPVTKDNKLIGIIGKRDLIYTCF
jgi:predicted transcriptional regulator